MSDTPPSIPAASAPQSLPELFARIPRPHRPRLAAWLCGLLYVLVIFVMEINRAEVWRSCGPDNAPEGLVSADRREMVPDPDGIRWVIYTQQAVEAGQLLIPHWSNEDNHPTGRFVGWSSPPSWFLRIMANVHSAATGSPLLESVSRVSPHYNTFIWFFASLGMGAICVLAFGPMGALVMPLLYALLFNSKYGIFSPDHHIWILLAGLGALVCLCAPFLGGAGQRRHWPWFAGAAVFSAFGMWISAPTHAIVVAAVFVGLVFLPEEAARSVRASGWRLYGILASLLSLVFYWVEFGSLLPMRVELNNPVYAAGLLVAGIWCWQAHEFAASDRRWDALQPRALVYSALLMLLTAAPLVIYLPQCFSLADPFFERWESQIAEEQALDMLRFMQGYAFLFIAVASALSAYIVRWKDSLAGLRAASILCVAVTLFYGYFGMSSNRFSDVMLAALVVLLTLALVGAGKSRLSYFAAAFLVLQGISSIHTSSVQKRNAQVYGMSMTTLGQTMTLRGVSEALLLLDSSADTPVLAPSYEANVINYYTRKPVYGTAYWENKDGLRWMCRVFYYERPEGTDPDWSFVRSLVQGGGVRYIYLPKNFTYDSSYMIYGKNRIVDPSHSFAYHILKSEAAALPTWLKLERDELSYRIFRVKDAAQGGELVP